MIVLPALGGSAGSSSTQPAVQQAMSAIACSRLEKPAALTKGLSAYTASGLIPNETASYKAGICRATTASCASDATVYTAASNRPSWAGSSSRPVCMAQCCHEPPPDLQGDSYTCITKQRVTCP